MIAMENRSSHHDCNAKQIHKHIPHHNPWLQWKTDPLTIIAMQSRSTNTHKSRCANIHACHEIYSLLRIQWKTDQIQKHPRHNPWLQWITNPLTMIAFENRSTIHDCNANQILSPKLHNTDSQTYIITLEVMRLFDGGGPPLAQKLANYTHKFEHASHNTLPTHQYWGFFYQCRHR